MEYTREEVSMAETKMPHPGHEEHLCYLQNVGFLLKNWDDYKKLVKNGKYICRACGRVAESESNLCVPEEL
jgi:hypothetical protein